MEYIKQEILGQSRHLFVYGYNYENREKLLESLEDDFPIKINENYPIALYLKDYALPNINQINRNLENDKAKILCKNFFEFSLSENIIKKVLEIQELGNLNIQIDKMLDRINRCFLNNQKTKISDLQELRETLIQSKNFYYNYYVSFLNGESNLPDIKDLQMQFIDIMALINFVKTMLNNNSYFGIIIDYQMEMPLVLQQTINGYITKRCNSDISMKVVCDIADWKTYYDLNGVLAESVHDYGIVELDNNYKDYTKILKKIID